MPVCPWSLSPSGQDLAFCCSADVPCLCLLLLLIVLHWRVYASVWECEPLWDRDRQTRRHAGETDYLLLSLSPSATHTLTHIISIISPSGELLANSRLVRPLLTLCLQCETKTNYIRCCVKQLQSFHRCRDQGLTKGSPLKHDKCDPLIFCKAVMTGTSQEKVATWLFVLGRLLVGSR